MKKIFMVLMLVILAPALWATPHNLLYNDPTNPALHGLHAPGFNSGTHAQRVAYPTSGLYLSDQWFETDTLSTYQWDGVSWGRISISVAETPTWTPTATFTSTNTNTPTATNTPTGSATPTNTPTFTGTRTPTLTFTPTFTITSTPTNTATIMPTSTPIPGTEVVLVGRDLSAYSAGITFVGTRIHVAMTTSTSNPALNPGDLVNFDDSNVELPLAGGVFFPVVNVGTNFFECDSRGISFDLTHAKQDMVVYQQFSKNVQFINAFYGGSVNEGVCTLVYTNPQTSFLFPRISVLTFYQLADAQNYSLFNLGGYETYYLSNNTISFIPYNSGGVAHMDAFFYLKLVNVQ